MNTDMVRYTTSGLEKRRRQQSETIVAEVRNAAQEADGAMAMAAHLMGNLTELDKLRQELAGDDHALNMLLSDIEGRAISQCKSIQTGLFNPNPWGL